MRRAASVTETVAPRSLETIICSWFSGDMKGESRGVSQKRQKSWRGGLPRKGHRGVFRLVLDLQGRKAAEKNIFGAERDWHYSQMIILMGAICEFE